MVSTLFSWTWRGTSVAAVLTLIIAALGCGTGYITEEMTVDAYRGVAEFGNQAIGIVTGGLGIAGGIAMARQKYLQLVAWTARMNAIAETLGMSAPSITQRP